MSDITTRFVWDLDCTYLQTDIESLSGMVRAAFEAPAEKKAYPGAKTVLRALKRVSSHRLHILSGSPRQLRRKLEEKLALDGLTWDRFQLKPNLENVLRGRLADVREQVGYKLAALLRWRAVCGRVDEVLVGDDMEVDAFVYSLYRDLIAGRVGQRSLHEVLTATGCHGDTRQRIDRALEQIVLEDRVRRIYVHLAKKTAPRSFIGLPVVPVYDYFQLVVLLYEEGDLALRDVVEVTKEFTATAGYGTAALRRSLADLVERARISTFSARRLSLIFAQDLGVSAWEDTAFLPQSGFLSAPSSTPDYVKIFGRCGGRMGLGEEG